MATTRVDEIVRYADGTCPHRGKVGLCVRCGGDPNVARGRAAIGTLGCVCNPAWGQKLTTEVGEVRADETAKGGAAS